MIPILYSTNTASGPELSGAAVSGAAAVSGPELSGAAAVSGAVATPLIPVDYITIAGPLPESPYLFDDGIVMKTEEDLQKMDISSLLLFSSTLSTSIGLETSSLIANQQIQGTYSILKRLSQSTIDGLDTEIRVNTSLINSYIQNAKYLDYVSSSYVSTMQEFDADIARELDAIRRYNSSISSYTKEYDASVSSMAKENKEFASTAKQYSTLYYIYMGYQTQFETNTRSLDSVNVSLRSARRRKEDSYTALQESTLRWRRVSEGLSSLYIHRTAIGSTLAQYRLDESDAYLKYISSIAGFSTTSSMYTAAVANEKYAMALLRSTQKSKEYSDALKRFQDAENLYNRSIPQGGGGASGASGSVLGNSALWAARLMAYEQLQAIDAEKIAEENATAALLKLADIANSYAYQALLESYDMQILANEEDERKFKDYSLSSLQAVTLFSSIYEKSALDVQLYEREMSHHNSLYNSSIIGASTLLGQSGDELSTILGDILYYNAVSWGISTLNDKYSTVMDNYTSSMLASTMFAEEYYRSMSNVRYYTDLYTSTQNAANTINTDFYGLGGRMHLYNTTLFTNSSILNKELIDAKAYDAQMKGYINLQDVSMYEYRESYCRTRRNLYQVTYESNVFVAVMLAEQSNTSNQALAAPGTTVTPIAADLTTAAVSNSYSRLNSMTTFLTKFSEIYTTFEAQDSNIQRLSTSVGKEASAWSTVDFYTTAQYFSTPMISSIDALVTRSCEKLAAAQDSTMALLADCTLNQSIIDNKKVFILSSLTTFFTPTEVKNQDDTISSFLIQSITDAAALLQSQGITVRV